MEQISHTKADHHEDPRKDFGVRDPAIDPVTRSWVQGDLKVESPKNIAGGPRRPSGNPKARHSMARAIGCGPQRWREQ
jgi:hypothetical protein